MREETIQQNLIELQDENKFICPLCEGSHGNNSNCQRND
jgi:hypothetical protein